MDKYFKYTVVISFIGGRYWSTPIKKKVVLPEINGKLYHIKVISITPCHGQEPNL